MSADNKAGHLQTGLFFSVAPPEGIGCDNDSQHNGEGDLYGSQTSIHSQRELLGGDIIR